MPTTEIVTLANSRTVKTPNPKPLPGDTLLNLFLGVNGSSDPGPQAFIMNFDPGIESKAHFHHVDQFHVFFDCPDSIYQRSEIGPLAVLYTDADTVYGPFRSETGPLHAFVLRPRGSNFIGHLPINRDDLIRTGPKRIHFKTLATWLGEPCPQSNEFLTNEIIPLANDGVACIATSAGEGATIRNPSANCYGGQYFLVVSGNVRCDDRDLPRMTVGWSPPGVEPPLLTVDSDGARVLFLQMLRHDE